MIVRPASRALVWSLIAVAGLDCSSGADARATPVSPIVEVPKAPPATIVVSSDTVSATLISGAGPVAR
jgi:hypothetical protein